MKRTISCFLAVIMVFTMILCTVSGGAAFHDPTASYIPQVAANEDSGISLWFDYSSKKISSADTQSSGMDTFTAYMAKNEIENIQFVLYAQEGRTDLDAQLQPFTNEHGDVIDSELFIQYYHDCGINGMVPDAIPPLSAYGSFDLHAGRSQAFLIKLKTTADTPEGWYSAELTIRNSQGQEVKKATVFAYVWDFALSEETACATSMNLDKSYLLRAHKGTALSETELYKAYYDYMLENRVCAYNLPYELYDTEALEYMDNPRVTSYQYPVDNAAIMQMLFIDAFNDPDMGAARFDKAYYFSNVVDAAKPTDLEALREHYDKMESQVAPYTPGYAKVPFWFISTYINDIDYPSPAGDTIDQIQYYSDFVNLWCSKTFAFTGKEELSVPGAKVLQPEKWDSIYGTFQERMAAKQQAGQKVWWFISWDVEAPYINYYMQTDGTAQRILFWQQFDNNVEGFLYNFANFWIADVENPYENTVSNAAYPNAYGESILLYPGTKYSIDGPIGSLRMEAMRDGIEDYQMLTMLQEYKDSAAADAWVDQLTTGMVRYSTDAEKYYSVRKALGEEIEAAAKMDNCAHEYTCTTVAATCKAAGSNTYTCSLCSHRYTEELPKLEHTYEDGVCAGCGAPGPSVTPSYKKGDIDGDGEITIRDIGLLRLSLADKYPQDAQMRLAGDIDGDGEITIRDVGMLRLYLADKITLN